MTWRTRSGTTSGGRPALRGEEPGALLDEQRIAAGPGVQLLDHRRRRARRRGRCAPGRRSPCRSSPARGRRTTSAGSAPSQSFSGGRHLRGLVAHAERERDAQPRRGGSKERPEREGGLVGPLQIVDGDEHRPLGARLLQPVRGGGEQRRPRPRRLAATTARLSPRALRSTRGHGQYGGDSLAAHRPIATAKPRSSARRAAASSKAVLPTPASPVTTTIERVTTRHARRAARRSAPARRVLPTRASSTNGIAADRRSHGDAMAAVAPTG